MAAPTRRWEHDGWAATFRAVPKKPEARGTRPNDRAIGVYGHTGVDFIDDAPAIKKALATKHHEYGDLGAPFIIAVGTYIHDRDRWHSGNAMYGRVAVQIGEAPDGSMVTREVRQPDGHFGTPPEWAKPQRLRGSPRESAHAVPRAASGDDPVAAPQPGPRASRPGCVAERHAKPCRQHAD